MKKIGHILPVSTIVLAVTMGSSIISSGTQQIEEEFGVSREVSILPFVSHQSRVLKVYSPAHIDG